MRRVYKYALERKGITVLYLPEGAQVVHADAHGEGASIWALVDPASATERRAFVLSFTGESVSDDAEHVGTFLVYGGAVVFHVFEVNQ